MEHKTKIIGIALLSLALGSEAFTLGRIRGAVLIGQPLDVAVQVELDASESASSLCFEADVFHADTRQASSRVRVQLVASTQAQGASVRILSSALVDEPVVTVYLRSGCSHKTTRRYVLLADLPSEVEAPVALLKGAPTAAASTTSSPVARRNVPVTASNPALRSQSPASRPAPKTTAPSPRSVMASVTRKATPATGRPRLKLELLELLEEREPLLNFSTELLTQPSVNPQRRAEAAALWKALNASPEETLRQSARTLALQADVNALKALTAKNQLGLNELGTRLHQAESQRFSAWVVYALLASLLACLGGLVFLRSRHRRLQAQGSDWWNGANTEHAPDADATEPNFTPEPKPAPAPQVPRPSPGAVKTPVAATEAVWKHSLPASDIDVSMVEVTHSFFDELMQADAAHPATVIVPATATPMTAAPQSPAPHTLILKSAAQAMVPAAPAVGGKSDASSRPRPAMAQLLDLDLSEPEIRPLALEPEASTEVDIPLWISNEPKPGRSRER